MTKRSVKKRQAPKWVFAAAAGLAAPAAHSCAKQPTEVFDDQISGGGSTANLAGCNLAGTNVCK